MLKFGLGLGINKGGIPPFNPLSLNPYLLFDTQSSMIGTFETPTLDLDPSNPSSLDIITATRAGVATYTDADGLIQTADPNTVRIDHVDGVPMMLIEPSATNLIEYSEDFSVAGWNKYGVSVTPLFSESPDGTTSASKLTDIESSDGDVGLTDFVSASPSTTYTFSAYFKASKESDVGKIIRIKLKRGSGTYTDQTQAVTLTNEWVRHSVTLTLLSDNTGISTSVTKEISSSNRANECLIWGAQLEEGSVATSYIPTSGSAVTRNGDDLVIDGAAFSNFYNPTEGTWYCEVVPKGNDGSANYTYIFEYGTDSSNRTGFFYYVNNGSVSVVSFESGTQFYTHVRYVDHTNQLTRMAYSYKSGNHNSAINGVGYSDTDAVVPAANQLTLGRGIGGGAGPLIGHIRRILFWPTHSDSL